MLEYALRCGYDIRGGFEDTLLLPDGRSARDNVELVAVACARADELTSV
ncbi:MAG: 3-keto-5-aminohexanoate cleavage protein [Chloroflexota bacterium]|nr:3-keto-5-aminohexanoate cleavage protein [Chloroflexota bacterium]